MMSNATVYNAQGPIIPVNSWTHIAVVYGYRNGIRLHINGQLIIASLTTGYLVTIDSSVRWYITLGNVGSSGPSASFSCASGSTPIVSGPFEGMIDEFRIYNRELNSQEICVLANP